jgi:hypothetical protein
MIQDLMRSYNQFITPESLKEMHQAWFVKLEHQENHIVKIVMERCDDEKMPNAGQILSRCKKFSIKSNDDIPLTSNEMRCHYIDYGDTDECEVSRYLCSNISDRWPIDKLQIQRCIRDRYDKKIICYWHQQVLIYKQKRKDSNRTLEESKMDFDQRMINCFTHYLNQKKGT